jgi:hypothetical protein
MAGGQLIFLRATCRSLVCTQRKSCAIETVMFSPNRAGYQSLHVFVAASTSELFF